MFHKDIVSYNFTFASPLLMPRESLGLFYVLYCKLSPAINILCLKLNEILALIDPVQVSNVDLIDLREITVHFCVR